MITAALAIERSEHRSIVIDVPAFSTRALLCAMASECYAPSELARSTNQLPFVGFTDGIATGNSLDEVASAVIRNSTSRAAFWGCFIVILTVFFMILTSVFYCCLYCLRKKHSQGSTALKLGCGGCVIVLIAVCLTIIGVAFWAETSLHNDFEASSGGVINALHQFDMSNSSEFEGFLSFETARNRVVLVFLVVAILVLLVLTASVILSAIFKKTAFLKIMLVVLGVTTLLISVIAGLGFGFLILLADVCVTGSEVYEHFIGGTFCDESRFTALCQLRADGLYQLANFRCQIPIFGDILGVCDLTIGELYSMLFQPVKNFCMDQLFCDATVGNLLELFTTSSNCVSTCQGLSSLGEVYQLFDTQCEREFRFSPNLVCNSPLPVLIIRGLLGCQTICETTVDGVLNSLMSVPGDFLPNLQCRNEDLQTYCNIFGGSLCTDQHPVVGDLNTICNDAYSSGFILLIMVCVLIITLILVQVAVATYTASIAAIDYDPDSDYGQSSGVGISLQMKALHSGVQEV